MKKLISISAAALIAATSATANVRHKEAAYARVGAYYNMPTAQDLKKVASFEIAGGYKFDENMRAELVGNFRTKAKLLDTDAQTSLQSWSIGVNGIYDINLNNQHFCPFLLLGVGFAQDKLSMNEQSAANATPTVKITAVMKNSGVVGRAGVGVRFHVGSNFDLQVGYNFVFRGKPTLKGSQSVTTGTNAAVVTPIDHEGRLNSHEIGVGAILWL